SVETSEPDDERCVVRTAAVTVQLDPVLEQPLDVVERVRAVLMSRQLDRAPDLLVGGSRLDPIELPLQLLQLPREAAATKQVEVAQARQPLAQVELVISCHRAPRRAAVAGRDAASAPDAGRSRRCGRSEGSARPGRSCPAASRASSAARRAAL